MENSLDMTDNWLKYCTSFIPQIKARHKQMTGHTCNLDNPIRLTDKMEWLKIYDSTFLKTYCSDKYTARNYVKKKMWLFLREIMRRILDYILMAR